MEDKNVKYLKWGIVGIVGAVGAYYAVPILAKLMVDMFTIIMYGTLSAAAIIALPVLSEYFAHGLFWLKTALWKTDPITTLWRQLLAFGKMIASLDEKIAEVIAARTGVQSMLKQNRQYLNVDDVLEQEADINEMIRAENELKEIQKELREEYRQMEADVKRNEAIWKLAIAKGKVADALNAAGQMSNGGTSAGIAMQAIQERLAKNQARLEIARNLNLEELRNRRRTVNTTAKVVPEAPALNNTPSPVIAAPVNTGNAKVQSLLNRI